MAIEYKCDTCGVTVNHDNGIIDKKEITLEKEEGKASIVISLENFWFHSGKEGDHPAICPQSMMPMSYFWVFQLW